MNEAGLRKELLHSLGHPLVCVEAAKQQDLMITAIARAYRWFNAYRGMTERAQLSLQEGTTEYALGDDVINVLDVFPPSSVDVSYSDFGFVGGFGGIYVGGLTYGGAGNLGQGGYGAWDPFPNSGAFQSLQMNETVSRIFGAEFEWGFINGSLIISPVPSAAATLIYDYLRALTDVSQVKDGTIDLDLIVRYARAELKEILGQVRGKFDSLPGTDGQITLNADRLLSESADEKEKLDILIRESGMPIPFYAQ